MGPEQAAPSAEREEDPGQAASSEAHEKDLTRVHSTRVDIREGDIWEGEHAKKLPKVTQIKWRGLLGKHEVVEEEGDDLTHDMCCAVLADAHRICGCQCRLLNASKRVCATLSGSTESGSTESRIDRQRWSEDEVKLHKRVVHVLGVLSRCAEDCELAQEAGEALAEYQETPIGR